VTDIFQTLGQNIKQLGVEISGDGIRVVTSVECIYAVKVAALALRDEVFAVAIRVLVQLRRDLGALLPFFLGVRKLADEECCSLRHGGYAFRTVTAVSVDSKEGDFWRGTKKPPVNATYLQGSGLWFLLFHAAMIHQRSLTSRLISDRTVYRGRIQAR
jgi:hypothetical protein